MLKAKVFKISSVIAAFLVIAAISTYKMEESPFSTFSIFKPNAQLQTMELDAVPLSFSETDRTMYINSNAVIVRNAPSDESEIIFSLDYADFVSVVGDNTDMSYGWVKVNINGTDGYISSEYLSNEMVFYEVSVPMYINQNFTLDDSVDFLRNTAALQTGFNTSYSRVSIDGEIYIIPSEYLSSETQPDPAEALNINYSSDDKYLPVLEKAYSLIGTPYGHGFSERLTDCVGLTKMCYEAAGVELPWSLEQANCGVSVEYSNIVPGDIIVWAPLGSSHVSHVGIYVGEGKMIHASSTVGVTVTNVSNYVKYGGNMLDVRRVKF